MGLKDDLDKFQDVGEENREDLTDFIEYGDLGQSHEDEINIPIKIIDLPEFDYDQFDQGGIGQGEGDVGDPVDAQPQPGDGDGDGDGDGEEDGEPGEESGEHGHYEMDPEEFAEELDEELDLDLEPKGKRVVEEKEGDYTDVSRNGPEATLDVDYMFKQGLKRKLSTHFDAEYMRELLRVEGFGPEKAYTWARDRSLTVAKSWLSREYEKIPVEERTKYAAPEDIGRKPMIQPDLGNMDSVPIRREDQRYRYPEIIEEKEKNVVVVNIRDVSGSMRENKRELVERIFTPMDWYLQGKYENAEFIYIAHDAEAWEVDREDFFGIRSGGGTKISSAYELAQELLDEHYPWQDWNRYVFAAGDGENSANDTEDNVIPLIEAIDANLHAYVTVDGSSGRYKEPAGETLEKHFDGTTPQNVAIEYVQDEDEVLAAIQGILSTEDN